MTGGRPRTAAGPPRRPAEGQPGQAGFTLLEVLVALAILGLAVVASIQGFAQGLRLLKLAGDHQQAVLLADRKLREVVRPLEGREEATESQFRWERTTTVVESPELARDGVVDRWRVYEIVVSVRWDRQREVRVATLRTVPLEAEALAEGAGEPGRAGPARPGTPPRRGPR